MRQRFKPDLLKVPRPAAVRLLPSSGYVAPHDSHVPFGCPAGLAVMVHITVPNPVAVPSKFCVDDHTSGRAGRETDGRTFQRVFADSLLSSH